ncbi:MAG: NAD(P)/FAD-dependent oxidoreductase [Alphaproteobacteria bacterium]|nr:NAD(P)/FAD-dependent oxidoreductase [Alphaproteobacteria bacterium]
MAQSERAPGPVQASYDAVVVGGGFAGLFALHRLRGLGFSVRLYEAGDGIGGTWFWNRYPGARVDIQSLEYSYQFDESLQQEWSWSERYAPQSELLDYANHVADRFNLRTDIQLNTRVKSARFDDGADVWIVETDKGEVVRASFVVMATGCLSSTNTPKFEGLESFKGRTFHTGRWPREDVDFTGRRVGVIGTGSSAIQSIPLIAAEAKHLTVFQRTANYSVPAHNGPIPEDIVRDVKSRYAQYRADNYNTALGADWGYRTDTAMEHTPEERDAEYESRWQRGGLSFYGSYADILSDPAANETAAEFIRGKIRQIVKDPAIAEKLCPTTAVGCKRMCVDTGYYDTYNRPNVSLVDLRETPIVAITPTGVRTSAGEHELDDIVFATGFDAMTGPLTRLDIRGVGGVSLKDAWEEGPKNYLGVSVAGFPNFFIIAGPGSPSVLSNMLPSIEQNVNWIAEAMAYLRQKGFTRMEAEVPAQEAWVTHVNETAAPTILMTCNSWYLGANIPGKPRVFMPYLGVAPYIAKCTEVVANGYEGFALA